MGLLEVGDDGEIVGALLLALAARGRSASPGVPLHEPANAGAFFRGAETSHAVKAKSRAFCSTDSTSSWMACTSFSPK